MAEPDLPRSERPGCGREPARPARPAATARAAACAFILQWWRIQSIGVTEPCASYSSVAAKMAALDAEVELEDIDAMPELHQVLPEFPGVCSRARHLDEVLDGLEERPEGSARHVDPLLHISVV